MSLKNVLDASSVAVVGASRKETKRGYQAVKTLIEEKFEGQIYPVNPKEESILGLRCYPRVSDIEAPVDMALITTPAGTIPEILVDCGKKGVAGAVIIAGGFAEAGEDGQDLQGRIVEIARKNNIRIIGPNTSGMMNLRKNLNLVGLRDVPRGRIALVCQSGNMALALITEASIKSQQGFSYYVGIGNEADLKFHEYLEFFQDDPNTTAILMYVEGMRDGRKFLQQAYQTTRRKPIVMLKSGRSATGKLSAGSHTGALAGMSEVARTAFRRAGIVVIDNSDELFPSAETLASLPHIRNNRIAVLADGGGHATIASDNLTDLDVDIPPLEEKIRERLRRILPAGASVRNPVDIAGGADENPGIFADCAEILLHDAQIGGLLIVGLFGGYNIRFAQSLAFVEEDAAHRMGKLVKATRKPIIVHSLYNFARPHSLDLLRYYNIPVYDSLEVACKCMACLSEYGHYLRSYHAREKFVFSKGRKSRRRGREIFRRAREEGREALYEHEARELIGLHGVPVSRTYLALSEDDAVQAARDIGGPVALKIVSPDILHKTEAGGVRLNLKTASEVGEAYRAIVEGAGKYDPHARIAGVLVEAMVEEGLEVIVGTKIDDQFGPVIMFGMGGIMVELLNDVVFRVLPISERTARRMIEKIRSVRLLNGFRGRPPVDKRAIKELLLTVSEIVGSYEDIQEIDLNPVIVHDKGLSIADARIILRKDKGSNNW
ncbi:MAG: acetate--CoA ligase family protein [Deltaproteobacteria bacterium]|nr:acetate--CoA ligase family protein [Deltaproteobacteria bacterium]MBW2047397.1 acetate--CoA ligase family protein [Deltaproteobacteria bacterium]MBW2110435.1 acetate--CoA ligase family protein [Deltaproteobacteria bacterium]MBW2353096.1 acetate--CoA ligase family protein [Deltaproteobacteria bacterium]HDZ90537.1 acyl-CoA synthetase [Deltaproteobacteria bacterium]